MACLSISMSELANLLLNSIGNQLTVLKQLSVSDDNKFIALLDINKFFPKITMTLIFNSFSEGVLKFDIQYNNQNKMMFSLINNMPLDDEGFISLENNQFCIRINSFLSENFIPVTMDGMYQKGDLMIINLSNKDI